MTPLDRPLRIGLPAEYFVEGLSPDVRAAIERAVDLLRADGHDVVNISLPHTRYAIPIYYILATAEASSNLARFDGARYGWRDPAAESLTDVYELTRADGFGPEVRRRIMMGTFVLSAGYYDAYYRKAQQVRRKLLEDFRQAFDAVDVIVAPTTPSTAFKQGEKIDDPLAMYLSDIYTAPANLAGMPAVSVPVGKDAAGLPIGMQIMGPWFQEERILRLGARTRDPGERGGEMTWELIVGLEIHAQLATETKAFCRCPNRYGEPPNTLTCPVCLGLPGALPVLTDRIVEQAAKLALAIQATIHPRCKFDRKNYFYPDLPKGYQISQYDEPFSTGGYIDIETAAGAKRIRITRAHIEEDAGKSMHLADGSTVVDMNRCGVPLVEIVERARFSTPQEAAAYVTAVRELLRYIEVCDGNMERGSLRCDVNISVRPAGQAALNERTEIKNLNSIRAVERAILVERDRQIGIYNAGGTVHRETLLWDEATEEIRAMRRKEGSDDYRYFPEPDLVELTVAPEFLDRIRAQLPELPWERRRRYREELQLHPEAVSVLAADRVLGDYFEAVLALGIEPRAAANWVQGEVRRYLVEHEVDITAFPVRPERPGRTDSRGAERDDFFKQGQGRVPPDARGRPRRRAGHCRSWPRAEHGRRRAAADAGGTAGAASPTSWGATGPERRTCSDFSWARR